MSLGGRAMYDVVSPLNDGRSHRLPPIRGGRDAPEEHRRLGLMRGFATDPTAKTFADPSRGAICIVCGLAIKPNQTEYEIVAATSAMTVDVDCYKAFMHLMAEARAAND